MRGYGQTDAPPEIASYTMLHLVGDVTGIVSALGEKQAIIVGHDFGASVAWNAALLRPEMFRAVAALSVPYRPRGPTPPLRALREQGLYTYYWLYYQDVGVADAEYDRDPRMTLRKTFYSLSGDAPRGGPNVRILQPGKGALDNLTNPERLPAWLTEDDLTYMAADLTRTGFRGGLNWYRNIDRNWELMAPWSGVQILQPALFIAGSEDHVIHGPTGKSQLDALKTNVPNLQRQLIIDGANDEQASTSTFWTYVAATIGPGSGSANVALAARSSCFPFALQGVGRDEHRAVGGQLYPCFPADGRTSESCRLSRRRCNHVLYT